MQFYGQAASAANRILELFKTGNLPKALAPMFIHRADNVPCRAWSWSNQLLTALAGHDDARGFRQWESAGRYVKKGERAFYILAPCTRRIEDTDDAGDKTERVAVVGFRGVPVFGYSQTDGEALPGRAASDQFIDALPLVNVARAWGLSVATYNGEHSGALGYYRHGQTIALGVENLSTWAHELIHAADDRRGALTRGRGQQIDNEVVAELGASILLTCIGRDADADYGGCWEYVESYAGRNKRPTIAVCEALLRRTCEAVALILQTADELAGKPALMVASESAGIESGIIESGVAA